MISRQEEAALAAYLKKIVKTKSLSTKEEHRLAVLIRQGDKQALNKLVTANLKFVISVAFNYVNQGVQIMDLISEGNLGLIKAATVFNESKGCRFNSYAVWWVRQKILKLLADQSRFVRVPLNNVNNLQKIHKLQKNSTTFLSPEEIAQKLNISLPTVNLLLQVNIPAASLSAAINSNDDNDLTVNDIIADNTTIDDIDKEAEYEVIRKILEHLDDRSREVLILYFGLKSDAKLGIDNTDNIQFTLQDIGNKFNLSRERVRQIKSFAMRRLRKVIEYVNKNLKPLEKECKYGEKKCAHE